MAKTATRARKGTRNCSSPTLAPGTIIPVGPGGAPSPERTSTSTGWHIFKHVTLGVFTLIAGYAFASWADNAPAGVWMVTVLWVMIILFGEER